MVASLTCPVAYKVANRRLTPKEKLALIRQVEEGRFSVSEACRRVGISRKTFYSWWKRYCLAKTREQGTVSALSPKKRFYSQIHPSTSPNLFMAEVLEVVKRNPSLSSRKIAKHTSLSEKGVWGILRRLGLNTYEKRKGFQRLYLAFRPWLALIFIAEYLLGGAIVPEIPLIYPFLVALPKKGRLVALYLFFLLLACGAGWKLNQALFISEPTLFGRIGLVLSEIALLFGMFFFLYSLKYYLTLTLVLLFSRGAGGSPNGILNGRLNGFLNGLTNKLNGNHLNSFLNGRLNNSSGLNSSLNSTNLNQIEIKEKPFVSIHLPFYNERRVAGRILEACSRLNYENFEVLVLDDSNDGTTQIVEEWTRRDERIRLVHRPNREGWKGGALRYALERMDPRTEYVIVFDADFIPFPDTIQWFLRYFHFLAGGLRNVAKSKIAAVQGYQWHVLNKDENWITRGIRGEYAGSYIIERSGTELFNSLKQIAGSVYMIRADLLRQFGWGTSITEDFQLTLRLYEKGYKVIYTPYIQAPAECLSTLKRLIRQRMRWAEGHTHNIRKMFSRILFSPSMNFAEKLEFLYLSPYYLQSLFFLIGTLAWLLAEIVFRAKLPFWTATWGWALVFTNMFSLVVMNAAGLFVEESDRRDYIGLLSFIATTYIVVPFQAYAAIKGLLERQEGPWFRTPKTGIITIEVMRRHFRRLFGWLFPRRAGERVRHRLSYLSPKTYRLNPQLALATAGSQFSNFMIPRRQGKWIGRSFLSLLLIFSVLLISFAPHAPYFAKQIKTRASGMILGPGQKGEDSTYPDDRLNLEELKPKEISPATYAFKSLDGGVIEIGTERHSPPQPYLKLDKWEGEVSLKVNLPFQTGKSPLQDGDKLRYSTSDLEAREGILGWIRWLFLKIREVLGFSVAAEERPKVEIEFYPKQPEEITEKIAGKPHSFKINEEGGVEFDTILYERPETNKITFPIETQGLKFYYQPPLHPDHPTWVDEDGDGNPDSFRPENVVGSYAVYHESKSGDYTALGGKNYRAGKAFHIYRPKITDANNSCIWGELNITIEQYSNLTITIPQDWLNNAVYPVTIDPRFGYETGGSSTQDAYDRISGSQFTSPGSGTVKSMSGYGVTYKLATAGNAKFAIYKHSDLSLIGGTNEGTWAPPGTTPEWVTLSFPSPQPSIENIDYALVVWCQNTVNYIYYDSGSTNQGHYDAETYGTWPDLLVPTHENRKYSIYATYAAKIDTSTSANATAYSFQRKTWYDGDGRLWSAFSSGTEIEFWYSNDWGSSWTQNSSATISGLTNLTANLSPDADGNYTQWEIYPTDPTTHYDKVDDPVGNPDEGNSYVKGYTYGGGDKDSFSFENLNQPEVTISQVKITVRAKIDNAGGSSIQILYRQASTDYVNSTKAFPTTSWINYSPSQWTYTTNPATGNPWTPSEIDAMEWGITWTQETGPTMWAPYVTQIWAEVKYNTPNDFSIEADSSDLFIAYTDGYDVKANEDSGNYPATDFTWGGTPTTVYDGSSDTDKYSYPSIAKDSNDKVWITARHYETDTSSFGNTSLESDESQDLENFIRGSKFSCPEAGTVDSITIKFRLWDASAGVKLKGAIYDSSLNLVGVTEERTFTTDGTLTETFNFTSPKPSLSVADYWLVAWMQDTAASQHVTYDLGGTGNGLYKSAVYNSFPDPLTGYTTESKKYTIYATYTTSTYYFKAIQSTTTNDISAWGTASTLDTSANSNKYGTIVPLSNGEMYATWIDGTTIEGKKYARYTVDKQVAVSGDDGYTSFFGFYNAAATLSIGCSQGFGPMYGRTFARWDGVTIEGTIDASYIELYADANGDGSPQMKVYGVDEDNPAAPTSEAELDADPLTTAAVDWDGAFTAGTWEQSGSLNTIFQELVDTYTISNEAVMVQVKDDGACSIFGDYHFNTPRSYDNTTAPANTWGPKLHIEYLDWESSATTIDTGVSGMTKNMSAVASTQSSVDYVHLIYDDASSNVIYDQWDSSNNNWTSFANQTLDSAGTCEYLTLSKNTANNDLYAIWIRGDDIYYSTDSSPYTSWSSATGWQTNGTNKWVTSNYSGNGMIFAQWTEGAASPYSVMWDYIIIPEKLLAVLVLGLILPKFWRKRMKDKMKKI